MANVSTWSETAANNNSSPPDGWPEGQSPASVNNCAREMMAAIAKWHSGIKGALVTAGSSNAYTLTTGSSHASLAAIGLVVFRANHTNTGASTLAVDGLTAKNLCVNGGILSAGQLVQNNLYAAIYNATNDVYDIVSQVTTNYDALSAPTRDARTSNTILGVGDLGKVIEITSGTFSQTFVAAATLGSGWFCYVYNSGSGIITLDPNSSETIDGSSTKSVQPGVALMVLCNGAAFFTMPVSSSPAENIVKVHTGNGHGSTNTRIRRFTTVLTNTGSAITYADSAANGASFTINETGLYAITYQDGGAGSQDIAFGVSVNSNELTTAVDSIAIDHLLGFTAINTNLTSNSFSTVAKLTIGDVVRPHTDAAPASTTAQTSNFRIRKIANL